MKLATDEQTKRTRPEPKSVTILRKVHRTQQLLINRRLPLNQVECDVSGPDLMQTVIGMFTPTLWDDIIEERSVAEICGYPFCVNKIRSLQTKRRKYGVSLKKGKLLNIEGRDSFCSGNCWKASSVLRSSLSEVSPQLREVPNIPLKVEKSMPVNHATGDPSNLLDALRIIEHDVSDVTPPVPPIVLRNEHDMIEGYRMRMPEGVGYSTKSDTKIQPSNVAGSSGSEGDRTNKSSEDADSTHFRMKSLVNHWYTDVTRSFLRNSIRVPLRGRDSSELFHQRAKVLYQMLCQNRQIVTNLKIDSAALDDDISCMIATFALSSSVPTLKSDEVEEVLKIILNDIASAAWQNESGINSVEKESISVSLLNNTGNANARKMAVDIKTLRTEGNTKSPRSYPTFFDGSPKEVICTPKINAKLYNVPGRAGAKPLGKSKPSTRRQMKKIFSPDGKYPLGYGL